MTITGRIDVHILATLRLAAVFGLQLRRERARAILRPGPLAAPLAARRPSDVRELRAGAAA